MRSFFHPEEYWCFSYFYNSNSSILNTFHVFWLIERKVKSFALQLGLVGWGKGVLYCILHHWGVQLILAYSWARPAILAAGMGRGGLFLISSESLLSFIFLFLPCPSLSPPLLSLLSPPFLWETTLSLGDYTFSGRRHKMTHKGWLKTQHNQFTLQ